MWSRGATLCKQLMGDMFKQSKQEHNLIYDGGLRHGALHANRSFTSVKASRNYRVQPTQQRAKRKSAIPKVSGKAPVPFHGPDEGSEDRRVKTKGEGGRTGKDTAKADALGPPPHRSGVLGRLRELDSNHRPGFLLHSHLWSPKTSGRRSPLGSLS